ncbi:nitrite reductase [Mycobacterium paragordonae]|uniref:nitrite reductase n=1 Tax=Mycobacterium paragordonae TaxID=1389713 RepID=UPI001E4A3A98|nr:nitrite reductase [Mycobacterium paragordonae]
MLVRLRLVGGHISIAAMSRLLAMSAQHADGRVRLTRRANIQVRALPAEGQLLTPEAASALESTGLVPSHSHELVRNILVSPQTGLAGGRVDLRPIAADLDARLCGTPALGRLPGRFLFTLDDGRGDLLGRLTGSGRRGTDLGLIALDESTVQLRIGDQWGPVVPLACAAARMIGLATKFLSLRGTRSDAPWHVRELSAPLRTPTLPDPRIPHSGAPLPYGDVPGGTHVAVPDGVLDSELFATVEDVAETTDLVVTPWHGILIPRSTKVRR